MPIYQSQSCGRRWRIGPILLQLSVQAAICSTALAACGLATGRNAVYWWIPEDRAPGSVIDTLPIDGRTDGAKPEIELRLVSGSHWFSLDSMNKQLILNRSVDRDFGDVKLDGIVECRSLIGDDFRVNISISVKVQDVNDNAPIFDTTQYYVNVTEELPVGTVVLSGIRAIDADQAGANSEVIYAIVNDGTLSSTLLTMPDPWEGTLTVNKRIDYEQLTNFSFAIIAKDNGFPAMSSTATVYVSIIDVDDQNPQFEHERYSATVGLHEQPDTILNVFPDPIRAYDVDTLNASLTYTLTGAESDFFKLDPQTGELRLAAAFAKAKNCLLTVHAAQNDRPERQASSMLVVKVAETYKRRRLGFSHAVFTSKVSESLPVNSQILQLSLIEDLDDVLSYRIHGDLSHHFRIDQQKGTIWLVKPLDYETQTEHHLLVTVTDGQQEAEANATVIVENANDNSPVFEHATNHFSINGTSDELLGSIGEITAYDADINDRILYSILNLNDIFDINDLGQLRVKDPVKLSNRSYELVVAATDSGDPPRVGHTIVKIEIQDKARWQSAGQLAVGRKTSEAGANAVLIATIFASVLLVLAVTVVLLAVYVCRLRQRKKRGLLETQNQRRLAEGIIMANPLEPSRTNRVSWSAPLAGEPTTPTTTVTEMSTAHALPFSLSESVSNIPLRVDTGSPVEYSVPMIGTTRFPGVVFRRPLTEEFDDKMNLARTSELSKFRPNSWTAAKPAPSLTVYF